MFRFNQNMNAPMPARVSNPPSKSLLIWDGECHFCRRWIERWHVITGSNVDYAPYQEVAERFPEIPREQFQRSVVYIDGNGQVFVAAAAVYRSLRCCRSKKWMWWSYQHVPGLAGVSELAYRVIAQNRPFASAMTRLLWGKDVRPPTYFWARRWFLSALGSIYLIAFISLWTQIHGLVGPKGIAPIAIYLANAKAQIGLNSISVLPTLCWINSSNFFLHFLCGGGVVLSLLLIVRVAPPISAALLFVFYLSLVVAGQNFLSFQWDILLLETGFLAIFLAPWQLWPRGNPGSAIPAKALSSIALFLLKFLLFKLMFMSGVVKLTSGDNCWGWVDHSFHWNALTALDYHYWTQPLPTVFAWFADKHPEWFKKFSVGFCLFVEIIVPFFIWAPRRVRLAAAGLIIFLQIAIAITGNYCFFNLLTIVLCLLLIDDASVAAVVGRSCREEYEPAATNDRGCNFVARWLAIVVLVTTMPLNIWHMYSAFQPQADLKQPILFLYEHLQPFYIANGYGLFRVMTKERPEIQVEGSVDGIDWIAYEFKWKPGNVNRAPRWCAPHQPRLDWQMWFAALGGPRQEAWFGNFVVRLLENEPSVTCLLARNPFPDKPPKYVRAVLFKYQFTTSEEHRTTGAWWKRREIGEFFPEASLRP